MYTTNCLTHENSSACFMLTLIWDYFFNVVSFQIWNSWKGLYATCYSELTLCLLPFSPFLIIFNDIKVDIAQVCWWRLYDIKLWVKCVIQHWILEFFFIINMFARSRRNLYSYLSILLLFFVIFIDEFGPHKGYWWGLCPAAWEQLTQEHFQNS